MALSLRIVLIVCATLVLLFIIRRIKKSKIDVMDSMFWLFFSLSFFCFGSFPADSFFLCRFVGLPDFSKFCFVYVIAVLVMRDFFEYDQDCHVA